MKKEKYESEKILDIKKMRPVFLKNFLMCFLIDAIKPNIFPNQF